VTEAEFLRACVRDGINVLQIIRYEPAPKPKPRKPKPKKRK
jgi:hypothetical protein